MNRDRVYFCTRSTFPSKCILLSIVSTLQVLNILTTSCFSYSVERVVKEHERTKSTLLSPFLASAHDKTFTLLDTGLRDYEWEVLRFLHTILNLFGYQIYFYPLRSKATLNQYK